MVHSADAVYFAQRAMQSRGAALAARDISSRRAHEVLCEAYEARAREAKAASALASLV